MALDLSSVAITETAPAHLWAITGESFTGKTSLASEFPAPIFLFTEEGVGQLNVHAFNGGHPVTSWPQVIEALQSLYQQEHSYQTLVIDSLDHLTGLIQRDVMSTFKVDNWEAIGYGRGEKASMQYWQTLIDWTLALKNYKQMHVVFTVHVEAKRFEPPGQEAYDRWQWAMYGRAAQHVQDNLAVALFLENKVYTREVESGFNGKRRIASDDATGQRTIHTNNTAAWYAKNRLGLPQQIPYVLGHGWAAIEAALRSPAHHQPPATVAPQA